MTLTTRLASRLASSTLVAFALASAAACGSSANSDQSASSAASTSAAALVQVPLFGKFEAALPVNVPSDAPPTITAKAIFTAPSGATETVQAFASGGVLKVRFAPREIGTYKFTATSTDASGDGGASKTVLTGSFLSVASADHGFLRVDSEDEHRFAFDDGKPFFVLGENRINIYDPTWNYDNLDPRAYVKLMAKRGITTLRVFVFTDAVSQVPGTNGLQLGCIEPKLQQFDNAQSDTFDDIFQEAEADGVYVVLTVFALGFSDPSNTWMTWNDNPYNKKHQGGPDAYTYDFFDLEGSRKQAEKKVEYALARWGYSTHLLAVDLLNEPEWDGGIGEDEWIPWAQELADDARTVDPYGHMITVGSVGLQWNIEGDETRWYADARESTIEWHLYGDTVYEVHALAATMTAKTQQTWSYGKPIFCGEFAYGGEDKTTYDHTHVGIWSATFAGAGVIAHSAPPYTIDSDEPMTDARAAHFTVLRGFLDSLDEHQAGSPVVSSAATDADASVWSMGDAEGRSVWILAPLTGYGNAVSGIQATLNGLDAGTYTVTWFDDVAGVDTASSTFTAAAGKPVTVTAPSFVRHIAAKIARQ